MSQISITFPDQSTRKYEKGTTPLAIAEQISQNLKKKAVAAKVNGRLFDLKLGIDQDSRLELLTWDDDEGMQVFWHSSAHLMAQAIKRIWPESKLEDGPPTDAGFFYDILLPEKISEDDFSKIESEMQKIVSEKFEVDRSVFNSKTEAKEFFEKQSEDFKLDLIDSFSDDEVITAYSQGEFTDLCRGPHLTDTGKIKAFKLLSVSGAFYKGDANNIQLQRIRGVSFPERKRLKEFLELIEEAKKRDHRKIGQELGLFHLTPKVGAGLPLWLPKGTIVRETLTDFLKEEQLKRGYQGVITPHIGSLELYKTSGHYPYYKDSQFAPITMESGEQFLLKPMNCPHHHHIYSSVPRSYRDLPLRLAEFGTVYRYEQSGEVHGLMRVRGFTQDDAHVYTTQDQLKDEIKDITELTYLVCNIFKLDVNIRLSFRDDDESKFGGDFKLWDKAQRVIKEVADEMKLDYIVGIGEASFYGPKIDFIVKDALRRKWQLGTVQVDYVMPERFDLTYTGADGLKHRPVIIHRAPFGSIERFIAMLTEHLAGNFPVWLAPIQVRIVAVSDRHADYAIDIENQLRDTKIRADVDLSNEKVGKKIRDAEILKIPYILVVGDNEIENKSVSVRRHGLGDQGVESLKDFIERLQTKIEEKALD